MNFADVKRWLPPTFGKRFTGTFNPPLPFVCQPLRFRAPCTPLADTPCPPAGAPTTTYSRTQKLSGVALPRPRAVTGQGVPFAFCVSGGLQQRQLRLTAVSASAYRRVVLGLHHVLKPCRQMPKNSSGMLRLHRSM
jgi:hypothetical protein